MRLLPAAFLLASGAAAAPVPLLSFAGYGAVRFGMTLTEAQRATGDTVQAQHPAQDPEACYYVTFTGYAHARFMVEEGHITRAELDKSGRTALGITAGMPLTEVRQRFPHVIIRPHKYDEAGHYLVFPSRSGNAEIVAEESAGQVTMVRGGLLPAVEYVEGCL